MGETGNQARTRFTQHLNDIRHNRDTPVAHHFNETPHILEEHLKFSIIQKANNVKYRKYQESILIKAFGSESPSGMNLRSDSIKRQSAIIPLVIPYSQDYARFASSIKDLNDRHQATKGRIITAFKRHKSLGNILKTTRN